jgi:hypothetical protein
MRDVRRIHTIRTTGTRYSARMKNMKEDQANSRRNVIIIVLVGLAGLVIVFCVGLGLLFGLAGSLNDVQKAESFLNTAKAGDHLRAIAAAEKAYYDRYTRYGTLAQLLEAGTLPQTWVAEGNEYGYRYSIAVSGTGSAYHANADPQAGGKYAWHFYIDGASDVRYNPRQPATSSDPLLRDARPPD